MRSARILIAAASLALVGCTSEEESPLRAFAAKIAHGAEMEPAIPILNVRSLRHSQAYFRDALGFKVAWEDGNPPDFGAVTRAETTFFLCQGCQSTRGAWSFVFVKDVDAYHREIAAKGALVRMPPRDMPWKLREMQVADRDGNIIRFAGPGEH